MMQFFEFITTGFRGSGAPIMFLIVIMLFAGIALIIERSMFLYGKCGSSRAFMAGIAKYINGGEVDKALSYAQSNDSPLGKVVTAILQNRGKGLKHVQRVVDEIFLQETPRVGKYLAYLQAFAYMSVLVGLAGTIYGFMEAFDSLANVPAAQRSQALASAIAIVMSSTLWGLISAIICLFSHTILATRSEKVLEEMDEKAAKLVNLLEAA